MGKPADVINVLRIKQKDRKGRGFYVTIGEEEIITSVPSDARDSNDLLATSTALTRVMSLALQNGVSWKKIKKQLKESSINKKDLPDLILKSVETWEKHQ